LKVALVLTGAINDGGWNQRGYEGLLSVKDKYQAETAYNENTNLLNITRSSELIRKMASILLLLMGLSLQMLLKK
ncbi:MAG: BMP family ABC transporter substrate-binding protein, partial [Fusobacteria bacterium]|nr:BMP family ABC transporter substrate-binding protein [Fusobacteriota bacterium]